MRRIAVLFFLVLFFVQAFAAPVYAEKAKQDEKPVDTGIIGKQVNTYYEDEDNKPGLLERTVSDGIISFANFLIKSFDMQDVTLLVFGKNPAPTDDGFLQGGNTNTDTRSGLYLGVFTEGMMNAINALYTVFEHFMPYPVMLALILIAFLLLWHGAFSSEGRSKGKDYATAFIVGLLSFRFGFYIWKFVADIVQFVTDLIWATMVDAGLNPGLFLNTVWGTGSAGYENMVSYRGFVVAILVLLAALMTAKLNYDYTMRLINLMVLISTFVICCVLTIFPKYRNALQTWWDQFVNNMILPCAHALALGLFFLLLYFSSDGVSNWVIVAYLFGFSSIQNLVQRVMGVEQPDSRMGRALGLGTIFAMSRMLSGKSTGYGKGSKMKDRQEGGTGNGAGLTDTVEGDNVSLGSVGSAASASSSKAISPVPNWKNKASKAGKSVAGFALNQGTKGVGMALGTSVGLMAGRPVEGALAGGFIGGVAGKGMAYAGVGAKRVGRGAVHLGREVYAGIQERLYPERTGDQEVLEETNRMSPSSGEGGSSSSAGVGIYQEQPTMKRTIPKQTEQPFKSTFSEDSQTASVGKSPVTASNVMYTRPYMEKSQDSRTEESMQASSNRNSMNTSVVNRGIQINGGNIQGGVTSINNEPQSRFSSTKSSANHVNQGIKISGGTIKGNVTSSDGNVAITGETTNGHRVASKGEHSSASNSQVPSSASNPNQQPHSPKPGGRHYNYHV
ncbi:hypothetical protein GCM10008014_00410 [Paenibacillus silvae]|uniref:Uncharacterized protein n=1 Tax=Paenibacillus silvae TaxID=1325358 RepID=A0ABQ1YYI4_9BACL|nr:hypothetical protein [Paenibacillus silvae]GGH41104.1 hypothetical protein GCM10008014_00410 [Paenibacillus silvae]